MEHRDSSGPRTLINHTSEGKGSRDANTGLIDHSDRDLKRSYDKVDYIFPQGNPKDTDPHNEKGVDEELRTAQMQLRKAEIKELESVLRAVLEGRGEEIARQNLRRPGYTGASSRGLRGIDWSAWKNRFHLKQVTILGHSFGAATTVEVLRDRESFLNISQGIIYDIWGAPVPLNKESQIKTPLLAINSKAFIYWENNYNVVTSVIDEARSNGALSWMLTVQGTVHISQSDFHLLYPGVCRQLLKSPVDPLRAITRNINASLEFLKLIMPRRMTVMNRGDDEGILRLPPLDEVPTARRPEDKWLGLRLKTAHDFVRSPPKSGKRGPIEQEVWMHIAPSEDELRRRGFVKAGAAERDAFERVDSRIHSKPLAKANGSAR